jgi:hypothetical protein
VQNIRVELFAEAQLDNLAAAGMPVETEALAGLAGSHRTGRWP